MLALLGWVGAHLWVADQTVIFMTDFSCGNGCPSGILGGGHSALFSYGFLWWLQEISCLFQRPLHLHI